MTYRTWKSDVSEWPGSSRDSVEPTESIESKANYGKTEMDIFIVLV